MGDVIFELTPTENLLFSELYKCKNTFLHSRKLCLITNINPNDLVHIVKSLQCKIVKHYHIDILYGNSIRLTEGVTDDTIELPLTKIKNSKCTCYVTKDRMVICNHCKINRRLK